MLELLGHAFLSLLVVREAGADTRFDIMGAYISSDELEIELS
jgi:hypothetical protein